MTVNGLTWLKCLTPIGVLGALAFFLVRKHPMATTLTPVHRRNLIVQAALNEVGSNDSYKYWSTVAPGVPQSATAKLSWCGGFALWAIKQAGLASNWFWQFGKGFLSQLPMTHSPQPGDIAYYDKNQHHAVVQSVNPDGTVSLINGNGAGGKVSLSTTKLSAVTAFYSIEPLLGGMA